MEPMPGDAYVYGDLDWPMPDPGLVAVWRAMPIDASRWDDWEGFVDELRTATIGTVIDELAEQPKAPLKLDITDTGVRLRARLGEHDADRWQQFAVAWRAAADLGASGELVWCPCTKAEVAYRAVIRDYVSQWEKLTGARVNVLDALPRSELDALAAPPPRARARTAKPVAKAKPKPKAKSKKR